VYDEMLIVGLTGSIAMGKSKTSSIFKQLGYKVFDADQVVHELYSTDLDIIKQIGNLCPKSVIDQKIDRNNLSKCLAQNSDLLKKIELIVHPRIQQLRTQFLENAKQQDCPFVILDIPLLFEADHADKVDKVIVVSTTPTIQKQRALARPNLTSEKFDWILAKQMPDDEKRQRADFIVDTSISIEDATSQVKKIVAILDPNHQF